MRTDTNRTLAGFILGLLLAMAVTMLAFLCLISGGCTRNVYVPVESVVTRTDTCFYAKLRVDSVTLRDSVAVIQRGDTVMITKWRDRYRVRERVDMVYSSATDSVTLRVPYPVERELTRWEKTKMDIGGWAIGAGSVLIVALIGMLVWLIKIKRRK